MLFALFDYYQYRTRRGKYSASNIERGGARLATSENFADISSHRPGDVFFMHTMNSVISWLIMYFTDSMWSHVGIISQDDYVVDATTAGVIEHPFSDYLDGQAFLLIVDTKIADERRAEALALVRSEIGTPYGWITVLRMGLDIVFGNRKDTHPRIFADVLIALTLLSLPALRWRGWMCVSGPLAACYLIALICNRRPGKHYPEQRVTEARNEFETHKHRHRQ